MTLTVTAYITQLLTLATLIMTMFINSTLVRNNTDKTNNPEKQNSKIITQINWMCIGAGIVASLINIHGVITGNSGIITIAIIVTVITTILTGACLYALHNDEDDSAE